MSDAEPATDHFGAVDARDVSFVMRSNYRTQVVGSLRDGPNTPSGIAAEQPGTIAHISRALNELRDRGVVELIVPEATRKGRLYALTSDGEALVTVAGDRVITEPERGDD